MMNEELNMMKWVGYWRKNIHRFVEDYLELKLYLYQKILLYMMNEYPLFMYIASRGAGKSWLIAVFCVARCILYPNTKVVIASSTKGQATLILSEKIENLISNSIALKTEVAKIELGQNKPKITFKNGSTISAVVSNDNARGYRANILILEEFVHIDEDTIKTVLIPFKNVIRIPEFAQNLPESERSKYVEPNKEIYISSAWYQSHWSFPKFKQYIEDMVNGLKTFAVSIPYQLSLFHGLLGREEVTNTKSDVNFNPLLFSMEYEALFAGSNNDAFFKLEDITKNRVIDKVFKQPSTIAYLDNKNLASPKSLCNIPRISGEIRIVSLDVALVGGGKNDTSAFTILRMIPHKDGYMRHVLYLETVKGKIESDNLAIKLRRLYNDAQCDYAVLDVNGLGISVYDSLASVLRDEERDEEYEPWASINNDQLSERYGGLNGKKVLYTLSPRAKENNDIATGLRSAFDSGKLKLPISEIEARERFIKYDKLNFLGLSPEEQLKELSVYIQSSLLTNELISLKYEIINGGNIRISEVGNATKDRYSSLAYANYVANELELELKENQKENTFFDFGFITKKW